MQRAVDMLLSASRRGGHALHGLARDGRKRVLLVNPRRSVWLDRVAYEMTCGSIPPQHDVVHTCGKINCYEPDHLGLERRT